MSRRIVGSIISPNQTTAGRRRPFRPRAAQAPNPATGCGPVSARARRRLFPRLHTRQSFLIRAGLSRRQVGWRGDLCAGLPSASGAGVPALPAGRTAHRGVSTRLSGAVRQGARPSTVCGRAGTPDVPHLWRRRAWLRTALVPHVPDERPRPVLLPGPLLLPVLREKEAAPVGRVAAREVAGSGAAPARGAHDAAPAATAVSEEAGASGGAIPGRS